MAKLSKKITSVFEFENWIYLLFLFISLPFLFVSTMRTVYVDNVSFQLIPIFELLGIGIFSFNFFVALNLLGALFLGVWIASKRVAFLALFILTYFILAGHYVSFLAFDGGFFANGTVLPVWFFVICLLQELSGSHSNPIFWIKSRQWLVALCFCAAGISKLLGAGIGWMIGDHFSQLMLFRYLLTGSELSLFVAESSFLSSTLAPLALLFELFGWTLLLTPVGAKVFGLIALSFIMYTYFVMDIAEFFYLFMPLFLIFFTNSIEEPNVEN